MYTIRENIRTVTNNYFHYQLIICILHLYHHHIYMCMSQHFFKLYDVALKLLVYQQKINQIQFWSINRPLSTKMSNILWFQPLKCEDLLTSSIIHQCKLNTSGLGTVGQIKQDIYWHHFGLWELDGQFSLFSVWLKIVVSCNLNMMFTLKPKN